MDLLEVLKVPIEKEKSSDETKQVPNLPLLFNSLCPLLKHHVSEDSGVGAFQEYEHFCEEIANTIAVIAAEGVQEIKDQEASLEDKMMFGNDNSPIQRLYKRGNRNLKGIS